MRSKPINSCRFVLGISVLAVAMVFAVGDVNAQVAYMEQGNIAIESSSGETARMTLGGDLFLGGNTWTGEIYLERPDNLRVGSWAASTLTLGNTGDDGDIFLKDSINNATTVQLDGTLGQIILGSSASTEDGDLSILDTDGSSSIFMDGNTGTITNQALGNGMVKGWAEISAAGSVTQCWRCNTNAAETRKISTGNYEVDFVFATSIATRPRTALLDTHVTGSVIGMIGLADRAGDATSVFVQTYNSSGVLSDQPFTVVIY